MYYFVIVTEVTGHRMQVRLSRFVVPLIFPAASE